MNTRSSFWPSRNSHGSSTFAMSKLQFSGTTRQGDSQVRSIPSVVVFGYRSAVQQETLDDDDAHQEQHRVSYHVTTKHTKLDCPTTISRSRVEYR